MDLFTGSLTSAGEMATPRSYFHLATVIREGREKMLAVGGEYEPVPDGGHQVDTVEEWVEECSTWKAAKRLTHARCAFGAVAVPRHKSCKM